MRITRYTIPGMVYMRKITTSNINIIHHYGGSGADVECISINFQERFV